MGKPIVRTIKTGQNHRDRFKAQKIKTPIFSQKNIGYANPKNAANGNFAGFNTVALYAAKSMAIIASEEITKTALTGRLRAFMILVFTGLKQNFFFCSR